MLRECIYIQRSIRIVGFYVVPYLQIQAAFFIR